MAGYAEEHAAISQRLKSAERRKRSTPIKRGEWSPISPDPAGGWWLYGDHYDTREEAEAARHG